MIDAVRSGAEAGTVHRFDAARGPLPASVAQLDVAVDVVAAAVREPP